MRNCLIKARESYQENRYFEIALVLIIFLLFKGGTEIFRIILRKILLVFACISFYFRYNAQDKLTFFNS